MTSTRLVTGDAFEGIQTVRNYLRGSSFELGIIQGWATYADAAATTPVDGTGGTPNVTFTAQSGSLIRNEFSGRLTKDAVNRQGQGASYAFSIDAADTGRPLSISFDFLAGGSYVAGDVDVFIYDVTNATFITPSTIDVPSGKGMFRAFFIASTSTSYRLILHVATTNASAWTLDTDNFYVGPQQQLSSAAVTDWQSYTPTVSGFTTSNLTAEYRQVGDTIFLRGRFTTATTSASPARLFLPNASLLAATPGALSVTSGYWIRNTAGVSSVKRGAINWTNGQNYFVFSNDDYTTAASPFSTIDATFWGGAGEIIAFETSVKISNWSSNVTMAERAVEEYAFNSDVSATALVTTSGSQAGIDGVQFSANWTIGTTYARNVDFASVYQPTDSIVVEVKDNNRNWVPATALFPGVAQSNSAYGIKWYTTPTNPNRVIVEFGGQGREPTGATYAGNGAPWSGLNATGWRWRVRKVSGGAAVGYPISSANIVGRTDGQAPASGYVGETKNGSGLRNFVNNTASNTGWALNQSLSLISVSTGTWLIRWSGEITVTSGTTSGARTLVLTTDTTDGWAPTINLSQTNMNWPFAASGSLDDTKTNVTILTVPANTTYDLRGKMFAQTHTSFTGEYRILIQAVRIA